MYEKMQAEVKYLNLEAENPLLHDREGLLTALTAIPQQYMREDKDFMRQLISGPNIHHESLFAITYDEEEKLDGRFQVIGEVERGWDTLVEIESACVQVPGS